MRVLSVPITPPELGASVDGCFGTMVRIPRNTDFSIDPDAAILERTVILEWCAEQGIEIARMDMTRRPRKDSDPIRFMPQKTDLEWEVFVVGSDVQAVIFKTRWG